MFESFRKQIVGLVLTFYKIIFSRLTNIKIEYVTATANNNVIKYTTLKGLDVVWFPKYHKMW